MAPAEPVGTGEEMKVRNFKTVKTVKRGTMFLKHLFLCHIADLLVQCY